MILDLEKLEPERIREDFDEIINKEKWKRVNLDDLQLMHTCKYYNSNSEKKKRMILDALLYQSNKDQNGISFIEAVM